MMKRSIADTVGRTPLVVLGRVGAGLAARVAVKIESLNPCGSVKDRIGVAMIDDAEQRGVLAPGGTIVEATSGNTGIALAFAAAARGNSLVLTMPERMSQNACACCAISAPSSYSPKGRSRTGRGRACAHARERPGAVELRQFENPANPEIHRRTTALEIWDDTQGAVDVFVAGVGTGGTITGVSEVLKARKPGVHVVAVEPAKAPVLAGGRAAPHLIQGIGAGFIPPVLNRAILDEIVGVREEDAFVYARRLAREEGISAGISSGASVAVACTLAARPELAGKLIVAMVCDTGERYVSTPLFDGLAPD